MSFEMAVASVMICSFALGIVMDETARWFYRNYVVDYEGDEFTEEEEEE